MVSQMSVQKLQDVLEDLDWDIAERAKQLEALRQHAAQLRAALTFLQGPAYTERQAQLVTEEVVEREALARPRPQPNKSVRNTLLEILREQGGPLHYRELTEMLFARGLVMGGRDPQGTVRSYLSHDDRFMPVGQGRWDLVSRQEGVQRGFNIIGPQLPPPGLLTQPVVDAVTRDADRSVTPVAEGQAGIEQETEEVAP